MKTFRDYITEGDTSSASDMESVIVRLWNNDKLNKKQLKYKDVGVNIVDYLRTLQIRDGVAVWSGRSTEPITDDWKKYGASNRTPKTDLIISDRRISLKMGPAQLMSGGREESYATFMASISKITGDHSHDVIDELGQLFDGFIKGLTNSGTVSDNIKNGTDDVITTVNETHKRMMSVLTKTFNDYPEFKREFVRESMSGYVKFGKNSTASSDWVLSSDKKAKHMSLYDINDVSFLNKISKLINVSVRFKSVSQKSKGVKTGKYSYWSVLSLITKTIKEEVDRCGGDVDILTEGVITDIWKRVLSKIKEWFNKAITWAMSSVENMLQFLNIGIDNVDIGFNNIIKL